MPVRTAFLALPGLAALAFFFVLPLVAVFSEALTGQALAAAFTQAGLFDAFLQSLALGFTAALISTLAGMAVALHLVTVPPRIRALLQLVIALPLTFSGLIIAYGFILVFGRAGFVTLLAAKFGADPGLLSELLYSRGGLVLAYAYFLIPRVILMLLPVFTNFDWRQIQAAQSLGAGYGRAVIGILGPQVLPSVLAAFCLVMAVAIGAYGTALALVGSQINILPLRIYTLVTATGADFPVAAAASLLLLAVCSLVMAAAEIFVMHTERTHVSH